MARWGPLFALGGLTAALTAAAQDPAPARLLPPTAPAQNAPTQKPPEKAPQPRRLDPTLAWTHTAQPISLAAALRLAEIANLDIAQAQEIVNRARAAWQRTRFAWLPNIGLGSTYVDHDGNIQRAQGEVVNANRNSLFVGGGPTMTFSAAEAIFLPLAARQVLDATRAGLQRVSNDTLQAVADAYFNVLRARRRLARVEETLDYLTSDRPSVARAGSRGLLPVVIAVQQAGGAEALKSEVERVRVEVLRRQEERSAAVQEFLVASAELARLLRLDPAIPLWPVEDFRYPMPLPVAPYLERPLEELVSLALSNRPELAENQALVRVAVERVRTAKWRPLMPNVVVNYSAGGFGGGPDPNPPIFTPPTRPGEVLRVTNQAGWGPSGRISNFSGRSDFDVTLVWRLQNLGLGNLAELREQEAASRQASLRLVQVRDLVVAQVVQVQELVEGWRQRVDTTRQALFDEKGQAKGPVFESLRLNFQRIREVEKTRPLEVLDSIRGLNDLLESYGLAVTDYERARFRLLTALGLPPRTILEMMAACAPAPARS
jgi:outer membrane protein TolC